MTLHITGMGTAVPTHSVDQLQAGRIWASYTDVGEKRARTVQALYRRSGIKRRHSVLLIGGEGGSQPLQTFFRPVESEGDLGPTTAERMKRFEADAPILAAQAAEKALADAGLESGQITHLVTVSCTGFFAPGPDTALVDLLGLPPTVERTNVGFMGCHGALNGLRVASAFAGARPHSRVLVSAVELCSLHMSYEWSPDALVANSLFGDGSAAVVGVGGGETTGSDSWRLVASGTCRLPESAEAMLWQIGNHGFNMTLSSAVPDIIQTHLKSWVAGWLRESELGLEDIATWAVHPGGPRILSAVEGALDLPREASAVSREVLSEFGNMSSATILFILQRLRAAETPRPCVALAFGPGLVAEAALFL